MTQKLLIVEDNSAPNIVVTLKRDGTAINLSTVGSVDLYISKDGTITNSGHTDCAISDPLLGIITYVPQTADFASAGTYNLEIKITYGDASVETIYEKFRIQARAKLST